MGWNLGYLLVFASSLLISIHFYRIGEEFGIWSQSSELRICLFACFFIQKSFSLYIFLFKCFISVTLNWKEETKSSSSRGPHLVSFIWDFHFPSQTYEILFFFESLPFIFLSYFESNLRYLFIINSIAVY